MSVGVADRPRIRHALPPARWPTREAAARARWFSPVGLGRLVEPEEVAAVAIALLHEDRTGDTIVIDGTRGERP